MKSYITIFFAFVLSSFGFGQTLDANETDVSSIGILNKDLTTFQFTKKATPLTFYSQRDDTTFSMLSSDTDFELNSDALNTTLFSDLNLIDINYQNDFNYSRGCGPLEDGLTHNINSSDIMISRFIDYAVNDYLKSLIFKD